MMVNVTGVKHKLREELHQRLLACTNSFEIDNFIDTLFQTVLFAIKTLRVNALFKLLRSIQYVVLLVLLVWYANSPLAAPENNIQIRSLYSEKLDAHSSSAEWASLTFNDREWKSIAQHGLPSQQAQYWIRNHFTVSSQETHEQGVLLSVLGAYELYWDGVLLGRNGVVGENAQTEIPGDIEGVFHVPKILYTQGPHVISARVSSYHSPDKLRQRTFWILLGRYENLINSGYRQNLLPVTMLGGIIIIGLYFLMMYFLYQRTQQILLFGLLCVSIAFLLLAESYRGLFGYSYDWHLYRLISVLLLNALVAGLLLAFFLQRFSLSHQKIWLGTTLALVLLASFSTEGYDGATYFIFLAGLLSSLCVTFVAVKQKKRDAIAACLSLLFVTILMLVFPRQFMDSYFFLCFGLLVLFTLVSLTLDLRARQKQHEAALLMSARLEIELLKKNIQPHFILNTLTAIEEWIEESPKVAIEFIDALANEFRVMSAMANQKLVPLAQELCLCRSHLEIMGFRTQIKFLLNTVELNENVMVPPAIFHTLLENAISHNHYRSGSIVFSLSLVEQENTCVFRFIAPLVAAQHGEATDRIKSEGGTGLRYIKARLEESFSQHWSLHEEAQATQWITQITIPKLLWLNAKVIN